MPANELVRLKRPRILIIDDYRPFADSLRRLLSSEVKVEASMETSGARALKALLDGAEYDLILCDLGLPDLSGEELYVQLREARPDLVARLVFMTGNVSLVGEFLEHVPNRCLEKPFAVEEIRMLLVA